MAPFHPEVHDAVCEKFAIVGTLVSPLHGRIDARVSNTIEDAPMNSGEAPPRAERFHDYIAHS
jgi:hypothetical protein